ncbi:ferric reductase like transmembrane component-domain-containing protein [Dactylonectria estremocensis]|uniref:Ferric reductase like transmembrane component-domain-containing protein n=1 Tax=Dactylonectria estremocensis TaxID=1079267 RepID=A0A9P9J5K4_9HYPO|nr:ferric reductase like transmembrane component-domain-containing protein [Dactylonectria estremocensis]
MALKRCLLLAWHANLALADGAGLIGMGKHMYKPACAFACRGVIKSCPLSCTPVEGGEVHGMGHSTTTTAPECYTSDPSFLRTMALCIDTYCPLTDVPSLSKLEDYWATHLATGSVGSPEWKPVVSYTEALLAARKDEAAVEEETTNSTESSSSHDHKLRRGIEARHGGHVESSAEDTTIVVDSPLPVIVSGDALNTTSFVLASDWQLQYNGMTAFEINETGHTRYTLAVLFVALFLPVVLSLLRFVPLFNRSRTWTWLNSTLIHPPAWGSSHRTPVASYLGGGLVPTRGQVLYVALISFLNVVFLVAPYYSLHPQSSFASLREQEVSLIGNRAGVLALGNMVALFVFSSRNNVLLYLTNWSHGTFLILHRWLGYWTIILTALHSVMLLAYYLLFGDYESEFVKLYWSWGIVGTVAAVAIWPASLLVVRQKAYELFLVTHQALALLFLIGFYYHIWYCYTYNWGYEIWMFIASGIWALERLVRVVRMVGKGLKTAVISTVEGSQGEYMRITIDGASAQGVVYLCFPTLSWRFWETHPFSVASSHSYEASPAVSTEREDVTSDVDLEKTAVHRVTRAEEKSPAASVEAPHPSTVKISNSAKFLVRTRSGMTSRLAARLAAFTGPIRLPVLLEGSYHSTQLTQLANCNSIVCFAGGVGITTVLPLLQTRGLRPARVYWGLRDDALQKELASDFSSLPVGVEVVVNVGERLDIASLVESELVGEDGSGGPVGILVSGPPGMADDVRMAVSRMGRSGELKSSFILVDEGFSW